MKFQSVTKWLRSTRTSAYLMSAVLGVFFLGQIIPQKRLLTPQGLATWRLEHPSLFSMLNKLGMLEIYTSPLAFIVLALFFLNLLFVLHVRLSTVWKKCAFDISGPVASGRSFPINVRGQGREEVIEKFRTLLRGQRFINNSDRFLAVKNRFGPLGSILFHLSFLVLLAGGLTLYYTRSTGTAFVAEGQYFNGEPGQFQSLRPPLIGEIPKLPFRVLKISPKYIEGKPVDLDVKVALPDTEGEGGTSQLRVNHPLVRGDTSMLIRQIDVAPVIRLEDASSKSIYEYAAVILHVLKDRADSYQVPFTPYRIDFEFYPDHAMEGGLDVSRSNEMKNPAFRVSVKDGGRELFNGLMRPGESREFAGLRFGIEDILYWGDFLQVTERGGMLLWAGFILGIAGLCWRFFFFRTEIRGEFQEGSVLVSFRSEQARAIGNRWMEEQLLRIERAFEVKDADNGTI